MGRGRPKIYVCVMLVMIFFPSLNISAVEGTVASLAPAQTYVLDKLRRHQMVFMGTTHKQPVILTLLAELLPRLHDAGVTHLALEISSDQQTNIDRFLTDRSGLQRVELHDAIDCPEYRSFLEAAADLPADRRPIVRGVDLPPDHYNGDKDRDGWMADRLLEIMQSRQDAKVLAVMGSLHVLHRLKWLPRIANGPASIQSRLRSQRPDLSMCAIVNIVPEAEPQCDFGRLLGPLPGVAALDLDHRFKGWTLGLTRCIAVAPVEPYELVDGVIVY